MSDKSPTPITILIADDEELARAGIRTLLSKASDMEIIGEAQDGFEVQKLVPKLRPKILLLDYRMPGPRAYELEKWVRENYPETTALVLTAHNRDEYLTKVIDSGMAGFLLKSENAEQLIELVRRAARGETLFDQAQLSRAARWREEMNKLDQLTPREREILELIKQGLDNNLIAQTLNISVKTAMYHTTNLFRKLQLKNRQEAALWALKYLPDNPEEYPGFNLDIPPVSKSEVGYRMPLVTPERLLTCKESPIIFRYTNCIQAFERIPICCAENPSWFLQP